MQSEMTLNNFGPWVLAQTRRTWSYFLPWVVFGFVLLFSDSGFTQSATETAAFTAAGRAFQDGIFARAEKEFREFAHNFPESVRVPEAWLMQARAALKQQKLTVTVEILTTNLARAGALADQYHYSLGEAHLQNTNFVAAAASFAQLIREFPDSARLLEASYGEALARFKMSDWPRVIGLLQTPDGSFQKAARVRSKDELVVRGNLLLGEALLAQRQYAAAEQALSDLHEPELIPEFKWRRQYLICRVQMADQRFEAALANTTNLLALAVASGQRNLVAESVNLQGKILEQLSQFEAAVQVYARNDVEGLPAESRKQAQLKIIELTLAQEKIAEAAQKLETFFNQHAGDAASDAALLTLAELHLKQHVAGLETNGTNVVASPVAATNHLQQALAELDQLLKKFPQSPFVSKAHLTRGWCLWVDGKIPESLAAFKIAAEQLPFSEDQAVARFKLADAQFAQKDYTNALQNYRAVVKEFGSLRRVKNELIDQALYQVLRTSIEVNDLASASAVLRNLLQSYPESPLNDGGMLLVAQNLTLAGKPSEAREVLSSFVKRFPGNGLLPEVELALARSYVQENKWELAVGKYDDWIGRFGTNENRPRAEYYRAWGNYRAGRETNAVALFTNFVAQFPTHELAPSARNWVADYYFRQSDFVSAEVNYQLLFQNTNWPTTTLTYQARMMAGRSAYARQVYKDADKYFTDLINVLLNDTNSSPDLLAEALWRLGDTVTEGSRVDPAKPLDSRFGEAILAFSRIAQQFPTNRWTPLAWGRIGDCHLQLAVQDLKRYDQATEAYQKVLNLPQADISARSHAEVGLALVLEKQAQAKAAPDSALLMKTAFDHYYNIVCGKNLREGEAHNAHWLKEAGLSAGRLAEEQKQWEVAINIYNRLSALLPPLRSMLEKKIERAQEQARAEKS